MSDRPNFEKLDQQEAVYAPEELPEGSRPKETADIEAAERGSATGEDAASFAAGAALLGHTAGGATHASVAAPGAAAQPTTGEVGLAQDAEDQAPAS